VLRTCLYPHDAAEVLKIRSMQIGEEDFIAWFYEKTGIFTVKSAYKLAQELEHMTNHDVGSSSSLSDGRQMYHGIWRARVPPKVRIFAWKVAHKCLATQENRRNMALVDRATCTICGRTEEMVHHALIRCSKASTLRKEMRQYWHLPEESKMTYTGPDWFLILLASLDADQKQNFLLLLWRVWYLRNDVVFGKGNEAIAGSVSFLTSYKDMLNEVMYKKPGLSMKGKEKIHDYQVADQKHSRPKRSSKWTAPPQGWVKLNTDASFWPDEGMASTGIVIQDWSGWVLLTAWRWLRN
jgi:hypothetical protein